jgi:hypothetical protein
MAVPVLSTTLAGSGLPPSKNATEPVGVPLDDFTLAVNNTGVPWVTCVADAEIVVVVGDKVFCVKLIVNVRFQLFCPVIGSTMRVCVASGEIAYCVLGPPLMELRVYMPVGTL